MTDAKTATSNMNSSAPFQPWRIRFAVVLAVLGGLAAISSLGGNVHILDIAVGAGINFALGLGIGAIVDHFRRKRHTA
jgi:hypothetical protein